MNQKIDRVSQLIALMTLIPVIVISLMNLTSLDVYWHLHMGLDFLQKGKSLFVDHVSITMQGEPIKNIAWLFQIVIAAFHEIFGGLLGLRIFRMVCFLAIFAIFVFVGRKRNWSWPVIALALLVLMVTTLGRRHVLTGVGILYFSRLVYV
ncbi:MAG: hypothetical protein R2827_16250 [Bdellovibrionales bacterium]